MTPEIDFKAINVLAGTDDIAESMPDIMRSDEVERGAGVIPETLIYNNTTMLDQGNTNECGTFGICKATNELLWVDGTYPGRAAVPVILRPLMVSGYGANPKTGSSMSGNIKMMINIGFLQGTYLCKDNDAIKQALISGCTVYTGSMHIQWDKCLMEYDVVFGPNPPFAHLFCIVGYDDVGFICANSRGTRVNKAGLFRVKYENMNQMYSCVALIDQKNSHIVTQIAADRQNMQEALEKGIWNVERPDDAIIGSELALVLQRLGEHYSAPLNTATYSRENIVQIISKVFNVPQSILRNQSNPDQLTTRYQTVLMAMRAINVS